MSNINPISAVFDAQRATIKNSHEAFSRSVDFQREAINAYTGSLSAQKSAQQRGLAVSHGAVDAYLDAIHSTMPGDTSWVDDLRAVVEQNFAAVSEIHEETWDAWEELVTENARAYETVSEDTLELVDESIDVVLEAQDQFEAQAQSAAEAVEVEIE